MKKKQTDQLDTLAKEAKENGTTYGKLQAQSYEVKVGKIPPNYRRAGSSINNGIVMN
jgi:hypothetical protein